MVEGQRLQLLEQDARVSFAFLEGALRILGSSPKGHHPLRAFSMGLAAFNGRDTLKHGWWGVNDGVQLKVIPSWVCSNQENLDNLGLPFG